MRLLLFYFVEFFENSSIFEKKPSTGLYSKKIRQKINYYNYK